MRQVKGQFIVISSRRLGLVVFVWQAGGCCCCSAAGLLASRSALDVEDLDMARRGGLVMVVCCAV